MNRIVLLLLLVLLVMGSCAYAELDYNSMSYDELLRINSLVQAALFQKGILADGVTIYPGVYKVGEEIPAGVYRAECKGAYSSALLNIYPDENNQSILSGKSYVMAELYGSSVVGKLVLEEGNIVDLTNGNIILSAYTGLFAK